jgi:hypothetical protein
MQRAFVGPIPSQLFMTRDNGWRRIRAPKDRLVITGQHSNLITPEHSFIVEFDYLQQAWSVEWVID